MAEAKDNKAPDLVEMMVKMVEMSIDEQGVYPHHGFVLGADDNLTVMAFDLTPEQVFTAIKRAIWDGAKEIVFDLDRVGKPGQGTTLNDLVTLFHFTSPNVWRYGIIEYQYEPRLVAPLNWENRFWNAMMAREVEMSGLKNMRSSVR